MFKKKYENNSSIITLNKRVCYEFFIVKKFEAGLALKGWEVKSLRAGKVNINNSYILIKNNEFFLFGANVIPLLTSTSDIYDQMRYRKLLMNKYELDSLYGYVNRKGYTIVVLSLFWKKAWCKIAIGLAKGKKKHDKRFHLKENEWYLNKINLIKKHKDF